MGMSCPWPDRDVTPNSEVPLPLLLLTLLLTLLLACPSVEYAFVREWSGVATTLVDDMLGWWCASYVCPCPCPRAFASSDSKYAKCSRCRVSPSRSASVSCTSLRLSTFHFISSNSLRCRDRVSSCEARSRAVCSCPVASISSLTSSTTVRSPLRNPGAWDDNHSSISAIPSCIC
jgi:hypothetical protein